LFDIITSTGPPNRRTPAQVIKTRQGTSSSIKSFALNLPLYPEIHQTQIHLQSLTRAHLAEQLKKPHHGEPITLCPLLQAHQIRKYPDPMGLQYVSFRPPLVHFRVQVLQAQDLPSLHIQRIRLFTLELSRHPVGSFPAPHMKKQCVDHTDCVQLSPVSRHPQSHRLQEPYYIHTALSFLFLHI